MFPDGTLLSRGLWNDRTRSSFDYANRLSEMALLRVIVGQVPAKLEWSCEEMRFTSSSQVKRYLRCPHGKGWSLFKTKATAGHPSAKAFLLWDEGQSTSTVSSSGMPSRSNLFARDFSSPT